MIPKTAKDRFHSLAGARAVVVGMGRTGLSTCRFLAAHGARVIATDEKPLRDIKGAGELEGLGVRIAAGGHADSALDGAEFVIVSPGVDSRIPFIAEARRRGACVMSDIELFSRFTELPVVAVTGTNGKSTTTALISEILRRGGMKVFTGGNIGTPALECMDEMRRGADYDLSVLEISSFHLELVDSFKAHVAVLLNVTEDHLDRYESFDSYAETKLRIFANQGPGDYAVANAADPVIARAIAEKRFNGTVIPFSSEARLLDEGLYMEEADAGDATIVMARGGRKTLYPVRGASLAGVHNMENMMAAIAASTAMGVDRDTIVKAITGFRGLRHRMELVRERDGVSYYNDSKSTNAGSLERALAGVRRPRSVVLIAGGRDKGGDYGVLVEEIRKKVKLLILIGEARERMSRELGEAAPTVGAGGLGEAVDIAALKAESGDMVLLSPACSSFDMFRNFEERGDEFRRLVERL